MPELEFGAAEFDLLVVGERGLAFADPNNYLVHNYQKNTGLNIKKTVVIFCPLNWSQLLEH